MRQEGDGRKSSNLHLKGPLQVRRGKKTDAMHPAVKAGILSCLAELLPPLAGEATSTALC